MTTLTRTNTETMARSGDALVVRLGALASDIADRGVEAHEAEVAWFAHLARGLRVGPVLADIVGDRHEPAIARERAFGRLAVLVAKALGSRAGDSASGQTARVGRAA